MSKILDPKEKDELDSIVREALRDHEKVIGHYINLIDFLVERIVKDVIEWHVTVTEPTDTLISEDGADERLFQQTGDMIEFHSKAEIDMPSSKFTIYDKDFKK